MKLLSKQEMIQEMVRQYGLTFGHSPSQSTVQIFDVFTNVWFDQIQAMQSITIPVPVSSEATSYKVYGRGNGFKEQDEIMRFEGEAPTPIPLKSCNHAWKTYTGLREVFEYCQHCDRKKDA